MMSTLQKLRALEARKCALLKQLDEERADFTFPCGCGVPHKIKECEALEVMYYISPRGCTDGDYWDFSELNITCPNTGNRNRILFRSIPEVPWDKRGHYDCNPEQQFLRMYRHLFKSVTKCYDKDSKPFWNNYYVSDNLKLFHIEIKIPTNTSKG